MNQKGIMNYERQVRIARAAVDNLEALRALYPYTVHKVEHLEIRHDANRGGKHYVLLDTKKGLIRDRRIGLGGLRELLSHAKIHAAFGAA